MTVLNRLFFIPLLLILFNPEVSAQKNFSGYYGSKKYIGIQFSLFPPYNNYFNIDENSKVEIKRTSFSPKTSLYIGILRNSKKQISLNASIYKPSEIRISGFDRATLYGSNIITTDTTNVIFNSLNYQFYVEFQSYSFLAPIGLNISSTFGLSITTYQYQLSKIHYTSDILANTYTKSEEYFIPKNSKVIRGFFGFKIGKSYLVSKKTIFDFGLKTSFFITRRNYYPDELTENNVEDSYKAITKKDIHLNHLIEFYASYKLYF